MRNDLLKNEVILSLPVAEQHKARRIWHYLEQNTDVQWSDRGELVFRRTLVPYSNIVELFSDILRRMARHLAPPGSFEFVQGLVDSNVPRTLITNTRRFREQVEEGMEQKQRYLPTTPSSKQEEEYCFRQVLPRRP